jgi:hypothetical protein
MKADPYNYVFVHYGDPDAAGHSYGWGGSEYNNAVAAINGYLGQIFYLVDNDARLKGKTSIIVTADHGGAGTDHSDANNQLDYTIPLYVWGPDVANTAKRDLYALNPAVRSEPGSARIKYSAAVQPIRHADSSNLALRMLGLDAIPGSTVNPLQDLLVNSNPPVDGACGAANGRTFSSAPASDLCYKGTASAVSGSGPWTWKCVGRYLGLNATCSANPLTHKLTAPATACEAGNPSSSIGDIRISYPAQRLR